MREGFERVHPSLMRWLALPTRPDPPTLEDPEERGDEPIRWELARDAARGAVGVELEPFQLGIGVEPWRSAVVDEATRCSLPVRVSSRADVAVLAAQHPLAQFVLAALGDDPNWQDTIAAIAPFANVAVDISGRRTVRGMLDEALTHLGAERLLWGTGDAMETGLAQLRALDVIAPGADVIEAIRWRNAARIFPRLGI
jgi:predicted TIM-barrel fold metal-dependent hydrolase